MDIAQNMWIRLTSRQFSHFKEVETYPGMVSLCPSMRSEKFLMQDKSAHATQNDQNFRKSESPKLKLNFNGPAGG